MGYDYIPRRAGLSATAGLSCLDWVIGLTLELAYSLALRWHWQAGSTAEARRSSGGHDAGGSGKRAAALMNINESRTRLH